MENTQKNDVPKCDIDKKWFNQIKINKNTQFRNTQLKQTKKNKNKNNSKAKNNYAYSHLHNIIDKTSKKWYLIIYNLWF